MRIEKTPIFEVSTFTGDIVVPEINTQAVIPFTIDKSINRKDSTEDVYYRIHIYESYRDEQKRIIINKIFEEIKNQKIKL